MVNSINLKKNQNKNSHCIALLKKKYIYINIILLSFKNFKILVDSIFFMIIKNGRQFIGSIIPIGSSFSSFARFTHHSNRPKHSANIWPRLSNPS